MELKGKYAVAKIFTDDIEQDCCEQIQRICDSKIVENSQVRIMPDVHLGKSSCIGFTQTIEGKVCPSTVSVDIGCGMQVLKFKKEVGDKIFTPENLKKFDELVRSKIPMGHHTRQTKHKFADEIDLSEIIALQESLN